MSRGDWIKLFRQLSDHELWTSEPFTRGQAWVDLLMLANWAPSQVRIRGVLVPLKRGQVLGSYRFLSERWRWSKGKVERFLNELRNEKQIETQNFGVSQVITITNYATYQSVEEADGDANRDADGTPTGHQRDDYKKKQEETRTLKKENAAVFLDAIPESFNTPEVVAEVTKWLAYYPAKFSQRFTDIELRGRLMECHRKGWSSERLAAAIRHSMNKGWRDWYEPKRNTSENAPEAERQMTQEEIDAAFERAGNGKGK